MKKLSIFLLSLFLCVGQAFALEVVRQKNVATYIMFPILKNDGTLITGATGLDSELNYFADGSAPQASFSDCTNEATEIGTTGQYYLSITQAEMNHDYDIIQVKSSSAGAITQTILIRTIAGVPQNVATVTTGGCSLDVSATGEAGLDFSNIKDATGAHTLTNITVPITTAVTNAVVLPTGTGAGQISLSSGAVTVGTNNDKTGYTASTVSDKTGYSLASDQAVNVTKWAGTTVATPDTAGYPKVTVKSGTGTGEVSLSSGAVTVGTNNDKTGYTASTVSDKTGYSLTQTFPTNFSSLAITVGGAVTAGTVSDKTGYALSSTGVDAIWDEVHTGHTTPDSFGLYIDSAVSTAGGGGLTAKDIWDYNVAGYTTAGLAGTYLKASGGAGDPWASDISTGYTGQAGEILRRIDRNLKVR